jgi:probable rRNA maturation factor
MTTALQIHVSIDDPRWRTARVTAARVRRAVRAALARQAAGLRAELSVALADDRRVRTLNRAWRKIDKPTNVLAFPAGDVSAAGLAGGPPRPLGDVIVAYETVAAEARAQGKTVADHLSHLLVHGVLHLLGFDHDTDAAAADMEAIEVAVLAGLGVADPYRTARAPATPRRARPTKTSTKPSPAPRRRARATARVA